MTLRRAAIIGVFACVQATTPASAQPTTAADHVRTATEYFRVGNFEAALAEYRAAYALDADATYLFAMAAIEEQRGGCAAAIELYDQFIATGPPSEDVAAATEAIAACRAKLGVEPTPDEPVEPAEPESRPPIVQTRRIEQPFYRDVVGDALAAGGLAGLVTGVVFVVRARGDVADAETPGLPQDDYDARWDRARDRQRIGWVAGGAGLALIAGAVLRWSLADRWTDVPIDTAAVIDPTSAGVIVGGRF